VARAEAKSRRVEEQQEGRLIKLSRPLVLTPSVLCAFFTAAIVSAHYR
jgi:hypothetical protein